MADSENNIVFFEVCEYVARRLAQRKQCLYSHALCVVKEVCQRIGEDFEAGVEYYAPSAKCHRDVYFDIYN